MRAASGVNAGFGQHCFRLDARDGQALLQAIVNLLTWSGETGANKREEGVEGVERERRLRIHIDTDDGGCYLWRRAEGARRHAGDNVRLAVELSCHRKNRHIAGLRCHVAGDFPLNHDDHERRLMLGFQEAAGYRLRRVVWQVRDELIGGVLRNEGRYIRFAGVGVDDADMRSRREFVRQRGGEVVVEFDGGKACGAFRERAGENAATWSDF